MSVWGTSIFSNDIADDIRREYSMLLGSGMSNIQVEQLLLTDYRSILNCNDSEEADFWFALALCEWKKGQLSEFVKTKALDFLNKGFGLTRWELIGDQKNISKRKRVLEELKNTLLSPMPQNVKIRKPTMTRCPWREGSLLAYRIMTNNNLADNSCYMKYALLRVVHVKKTPLSRFLPNELYNESMYVALYGWIGDSIPSPDIVNNLSYIIIKNYSLFPQDTVFDFAPLKALPEESQTMLQQKFSELTNPIVEMYVNLLWSNKKQDAGVITLLNCDDNFAQNCPDFLKVSKYPTITHYYPFDITLSQRLVQYLN